MKQGLIDEISLRSRSHTRRIFQSPFALVETPSSQSKSHPISIPPKSTTLVDSLDLEIPKKSGAENTTTSTPTKTRRKTVSSSSPPAILKRDRKSISVDMPASIKDPTTSMGKDGEVRDEELLNKRKEEEKVQSREDYESDESDVEYFSLSDEDEFPSWFENKELSSSADGLGFMIGVADEDGREYEGLEVKGDNIPIKQAERNEEDR